jgi:predicted Zn-dependent protease
MTLKQAEINYKRAVTRHNNEQERGKHDISVKQTKRMYYAVGAMQKAYWNLKTVKHDLGLDTRVANYGKRGGIL